MTDEQLKTWAGVAHRVTLHRTDEGPSTMSVAVWSLAELPLLLSVASDEDEDCHALLARALTLALADVSPAALPEKLIVPEIFRDRLARLAEGRFVVEVGEPPGGRLVWVDLCAELGTGLGDPRWLVDPSESAARFLRHAAALFACRPWEARAGGILAVGKDEWCLGHDAPKVESGELLCFTPVRGPSSEVLVVGFAFVASEPKVEELLAAYGWPHTGALPILHRSSATEIAIPLTDGDFELASALCLGLTKAMSTEKRRFQTTTAHPYLGEIKVSLMPRDSDMTGPYVLDAVKTLISSGIPHTEAIVGVFRSPVELAIEAVVDAILPESERPRREEWIARAKASGLMYIAVELDDIARPNRLR